MCCQSPPDCIIVAQMRSTSISSSANFLRDLFSQDFSHCCRFHQMTMMVMVMTMVMMVAMMMVMVIGYRQIASIFLLKQNQAQGTVQHIGRDFNLRLNFQGFCYVKERIIFNEFLLIKSCNNEILFYVLYHICKINVKCMKNRYTPDHYLTLMGGCGWSVRFIIEGEKKWEKLHRLLPSTTSSIEMQDWTI